MRTKKCNVCGKVKQIIDFRYREKYQRYEYRCKDCEKISNAINKKKWIEKNIEHERERNRKRNLTEKRKAWKRQYVGKYKNHRKKNDLDYKNRIKLTDKLYRSIRQKDEIKENIRIDLFGCTIKELKIHIENQFRNGMSWENNNRDGWHIDHIIPCSAFDLSDIKQQKECFHYSNLQPLWCYENLEKHDKIDYKVVSW